MNEQIIYCVDDEENIRTLYEEALPMGGYVCKTFEEASSFWNALKESRPSLILLDIMLPGTSGMDILSDLMKSEYANIPVILVSAKDKETDKVKGLNDGASDYISKPFGIMELLARIRANIRKVDKNDDLQYKELVISNQHHEISLNGLPLHLSIKEYDLLSYFMHNIDKALSKEELLSKVWGIDCDIETRTIDMFVSRIRKKIAKSSVNIDTVRGVGYIMR